MSTLDGAIPFPEMHDPAVLVPEHLKFHVARADDASLQVDTRITESGRRFVLGRLEELGKALSVVGDPHPLPAAASDPGTVGTPTSIMVRRAVALSPIARIWSGVGPMKVIPARSQISLNSAFSARNPYPGWMASAPVTSAAAMIRGMFR